MLKTVIFHAWIFGMIFLRSMFDHLPISSEFMLIMGQDLSP